MRLIDADALKKPIIELLENEWGYEGIREDVSRIIDNMPTLPNPCGKPCAFEKPHGEWIWKKDEAALRTYDLLCSECGYKTFTCENYDNVEQAKKVVDDRIREGKTLFPFCPNCGARMKGGDEK